MLELSYWEIKTAMFNMLRVLMEEIGNMQEQMGSINRKMKILLFEESKRKARDQKHCNWNEEYLWWAY